MPRKHLGAGLYSPKITLPKNRLTNPRVKYSLEPCLIPKFEGQANSTYTIRVSRLWLDAHHREAICADKHLWGAGIFTDDSDPIAAAIHSGFIKGEWGPDVDTTLLDQIIREQNPKIDAAENVPAVPQVPPDDKDLHITILLLPKLEKYASAVRYGIKSRTWPEKPNDAPHDGISFMILRCDWVNEGSARGQGRTGQARRERLNNSLLLSKQLLKEAKTLITVDPTH